MRHVFQLYIRFAIRQLREIGRVRGLDKIFPNRENERIAVRKHQRTQISPKLIERWRAEWRAQGEASFPMTADPIVPTFAGCPRGLSAESIHRTRA
jgi:hypothetical protein